MLLLSALALGLIESQSLDGGAAINNQLMPSAPVTSPSIVSNNASLDLNYSQHQNDLQWTHRDNTNSRNVVGPGLWSLEPQCPELTWHTPTNHLYFQIGNGLFLLAFLAPNTRSGFLWLRCVLVIGCCMIIMWGWLIQCSFDIMMWFSLFLLINFVHTLVLIFRLRPVKFDKEIEAVYVALFKPLRVSRLQFRKVLNCMKLIRPLKYQEVYAQEKVTKVDSLSLVLSGKLVVSQNQRALHIVFPHQFLDSPEWFGVSTDDFFQVSIMAMEESRILIWHRDKLKLSIMAEPFLQAVFDHILGRDVVKKLMQVTQVSETMAASNGFISSGYDDAEDKPMLLMKKGGDGHGLTALINRQLQDEHVPLLNDPPPCFKPRQPPPPPFRPHLDDYANEKSSKTSAC